jgi:surfactin synthase thioesterase subunit
MPSSPSPHSRQAGSTSSPCARQETGTRPRRPDPRGLAAASAATLKDSRELADRPFVLPGHSMSAALTFETAVPHPRSAARAARRVRAPGLRQPSGVAAAHAGQRLPARGAGRTWGNPDELRDLDLMQPFLGTIGYGLEALEPYEPDGALARFLVLTLAETQDRSAHPKVVKQWDLRIRGPFTSMFLPGGYFSLFERPGLALEAVGSHLATFTGPGTVR